MAVLQYKCPLPSSSAEFTRRKFSTLEIRNCLFTIPPISETNQRKSQQTLAYEQSNNGCGNSSSSPTSFSELIESLIDGVDLSESEAESALHFLLNDANEALISAFLVLLRAKGETYEEVVGLVRAMIKHCKKVEGLSDGVAIVGTGGDGANIVNISILAAACRAKVAKQGNRSRSSACDSA